MSCSDQMNHDLTLQCFLFFVFLIRFVMIIFRAARQCRGHSLADAGGSSPERNRL